MNNRLSEISEAQIDHWIAGLDLITDGDLAADMLIACGQCAIPYLAHFLLDGPPRTIALPRCRAVRVLAELAAFPPLISYFLKYKRSQDAAILFAEDAIRSAIARELLRWKTEEVFNTLLDAARQRATSGLIFALGEFRRPESVPLLFDVLEDDLCREEAKDGLRKVPDAAREYAILSIRGLTSTTFYGPCAVRRRRAVLQLVKEFGIPPNEWEDIRPFLLEKDPDILIAVAQIGATAAPRSDQPQIIAALLNNSDHLNWLQEKDVIQLMDAYPDLAYETAQRAERKRFDHGEELNWLSPFWRIVWHVLDRTGTTSRGYRITLRHLGILIS